MSQYHNHRGKITPLFQNVPFPQREMKSCRGKGSDMRNVQEHPISGDLEPQKRNIWVNFLRLLPKPLRSI